MGGPVFQDMAVRPAETHGNSAEKRRSQRVAVTFIDQFAAINRFVTGHESRIIGTALQDLHPPFDILPGKGRHAENGDHRPSIPVQGRFFQKLPEGDMAHAGSRNSFPDAAEGRIVQNAHMGKVTTCRCLDSVGHSALAHLEKQVSGGQSRRPAGHRQHGKPQTGNCFPSHSELPCHSERSEESAGIHRMSSSLRHQVSCRLA